MQRPEEGTLVGEPSHGNDLRAAARVVAAFFAVGLLFLAGLLIYTLVGREAGPPRAVIVDQLSLTAPNPAFAEEATAALERAGYEVDYVPGEQVSVDFYRNLPKRGYDLVLLRAHAGRHLRGDGEETENVALFTSEPYIPTRHVEEQRDGRLTIGAFEREDLGGAEAYFAIPAEFVESSMKGGFGGAAVILMGCDVLRGELLAEAFVGKGAAAVVGWDGPVSASHTDAATLNLLQHYLLEDLPVQEAAAAAMAEVGPDPFYDSVFLSYPTGG